MINVVVSVKSSNFVLSAFIFYFYSIIKNSAFVKSQLYIHNP